MVGGIVLVVVLVLVFPVVTIMSMTAVAAVLGATTKNSVDAEHNGSELLEISEANPYGNG